MSEDAPPRQRVCEEYKVRDRIGSGGFADVWKAVNDDGQEVAVKFPEFGADATNKPEEVRERFDRAFRVLSTFEAGILPTSMVRFIDGHRDDPMCLVTELIEGEELSDYVANTGVSPGMDAVWSYGVPVARALGMLHRNGYVYLDCKPENILVRSNHDRPVLIDFNTAEPLAETNDTLFYQDAYKAPEQVPGALEDVESGPYSDVYSVAKLLCFLLSGQTLETSETPESGMDVTKYGADPPDEIVNILKQATHTDPKKRPNNCCELVTQIYQADGRNPWISSITDVRNDVVCPVRVGDTLGRVVKTQPLPTLSVADPEQYISPIHLAFGYDNEWIIKEKSLNGTFFRIDQEWQFMLSEQGYNHLKSQDHPRVQDQRPYEAVQPADTIELSPVDPSYPIQFRFNPEYE